MSDMEGTESKLRWYHLTPDRLVLLLLVVECVLWLSNWLGWPSWHKGYAVLTSAAVLGAFVLLMLIWFIIALVFRRQFQFSIRSLLVLVIAVALPFSWLGVEMKKAREQKEAVAAISKAGGDVCYNIYCGSSSQICVPPRSGWLDNVLGDDFQAVSFYNNVKVTDDALEHFAGLKHVEMLNLTGTKITDVGLEHLKGMKQLEFLELTGTQVTNAGLEHLKGLDQLKWLELGDTKITDAGLEYLTALHQLRQLRLDGTQVTDAGLEHLKSLNRLEILDLSNTKVTKAAIKDLKKVLPRCDIYQ